MLNFSKEAFVTFPKEKLEYTWSVLEDKEGRMWFASYGNGLKKMENGIIQEVTDYLKITPKLSKSFYMGAAKGKSGDLVFTSSNGLLKYDGENFSVLDNWGSLFAFEVPEKGLWMSAAKGGVRVIDEEKGLIRHLKSSDDLHPMSYLININQDKNRQFWLGSYRGLSRWDMETDSIWNYTPEQGTLPDMGIISSFEDKRRNMWFGGLKGLWLYNYQLDTFDAIAEDFIFHPC